MHKNEFILKALVTPAVLSRNFLVLMLTTLIKTKRSKGQYHIHVGEGKCWFYEGNEKVYITGGYVNGEPLFQVNSPLLLPAGTLKNQPEEIQTTFGKAMVNRVLLDECFGDIVPYKNHQFSMSEIMTDIADKLVRTGEPQEGMIEIVDMKKSCTYLRLFSSMSSLVVHAATPKTVVSPKGMGAFKKKLLATYTEPYTQQDLFEIERELKKFDEEWLRGDPSNGIVMAGKVKGVARTKMYLTFGSSADVGGGVAAPIVASLTDRLPDDKKHHATLMDGVRGGSYARGASTVLGGVTTSLLISTTSHLSLVEGDCGTKRGIVRLITMKDKKKWYGLYYINTKKKPIRITKENIASLDGKYINMRSPMRCLSARGTYCHMCVGENLFPYKNSVQLAVSSISKEVMDAFMQGSHAKVVNMEEINFDIDLS